MPVHPWPERAAGGAARWVEFVLQQRGRTVVTVLLLAAAAAWYVPEQLRFNLDTRDMLSPELPWRRVDLVHANTFPQYRDTLLVVLEGRSRDEVADAARRVRGRLRARPDLFRDVHYLPAELFFRHRAFLYLDYEELRLLGDRLARAQPFLGPLLRDPSLHGLFGLLRLAAAGQESGSEGLENRVARVLEDSVAGRTRRLPWSESAGTGVAAREGRRAVLLVKPRLNFASLSPARAPVEYLRVLQEERGSVAGGLRMRLTGDAMLAHEELLSVSRNMGRAVLLALLLVLLILGFGLRSARMVAAVLVTLLVGLLLTTAWAVLTVRELNLISVAFTVLYIGLAVDFAIHYCLHCREQAASRSLPEALCAAARSSGGALLLCALSTAVGFFSFLPTAFSGVAQLGWIAGCGMFIGLALTFTLLPVLLSWGGVRPLPACPAAAAGRRSRWSWPERHRRHVYGAALVFAAGAALLATRLEFDADVLNLNDQNAESVRTFRHLLRAGDDSPRSISVIAPDADTAQDWQQRLDALPEVSGTISLHDFVPPDQDRKLELLGDLELLLAGSLEAAPPGRPEAARELHALRDYRAEVCAAVPPSKQQGEQQGAARRRLCAAVEQLSEELQRVPQERREALLHGLRDMLFFYLPSLAEDLRLGLEGSAFGPADLPADLVGRWVSSDGRLLVQVLPAGNLDGEQQLRRFVTAVRTVAPEVSGPPVAMLEAGDAVARAFLQALGGALAAITLLLVLVYRRFDRILCVLLPLGLACLLTLAAAVLLGVPLNFANIIALPLLLGLGLDNSIHLLQRRLAPGGRTVPLLRSAGARGVVLSGLTTIAGVGSLALSDHAGTAGMGLLLTLGVLFCMLCSLALVPALGARPAAHPAAPGDAA